MEFILNEYHRNISDEDLLGDVKKIAYKINKRSITVKEYDANGKYNSTTLRRRFGSWKNVLQLAGLTIEKKNFQISNEEYLLDIKRVAEILQKNSVTNSEYKKYGKYDVSKLSKRFGGWEKVLETAKLLPTGYNHSISDNDLLEEIERLWIELGRQPTTNDIKKGLSKYGLTTFLRRFGSWNNCLNNFIVYVNSYSGKTEHDQNNNDDSNMEFEEAIGLSMKHKTSREINLRLRFLVMKRDNFKCCICGATPATNPSIELHIDHIIPWSKGGETTIDNLQTLCSNCNLGKGDIL